MHRLITRIRYDSDEMRSLPDGPFRRLSSAIVCFNKPAGIRCCNTIMLRDSCLQLHITLAKLPLYQPTLLEPTRRAQRCALARSLRKYAISPSISDSIQ